MRASDTDIRPATTSGLALDAFLPTMVGQPTLLSAAEASDVARRLYGLRATASPLTGERDENFHLATAEGEQYVLKVSNPAEDPQITDFPTAAMLHVEALDPGLPCPRVLRDLARRTSSRFRDGSGQVRTVRVLTWMDGVMLQSSTRSAAQRRTCGAMCARLARALRDFRHPAQHRPLLWDYRHLEQLTPMLAEVVRHVPGFAPAGFIADFLREYHAVAEPRFAALRQQVLHNDMNLRNVLVEAADHTRVVGIIDFGDIVHSVVVGDLAVATTAQITSAATLEVELLDTVRAYHAAEPLVDEELFMLPWLVRARFVMGILIPAWHHIMNPGNAHYLGKKEADIQERMEMSRVLSRIHLTPEQLR